MQKNTSGNNTGNDTSEMYEKTVANNTDSDKIDTSKEKEGIEVHSVCKIDKDKFKSISGDIATDEVIITDERIGHIKQRRGEGFYSKYASKFAEILENPDYIFADKTNTALVCKTFMEDGRSVNIALKLVTSSDNPGYKNSIITAVLESEKRFQQRLRNNVPVYKKE